MGDEFLFEVWRSGKLKDKLIGGAVLPIQAVADNLSDQENNNITADSGDAVDKNGSKSGFLVSCWLALLKGSDSEHRKEKGKLLVTVKLPARAAVDAATEAQPLLHGQTNDDSDNDELVDIVHDQRLSPQQARLPSTSSHQLRTQLLVSRTGVSSVDTGRPSSPVLSEIGSVTSVASSAAAALNSSFYDADFKTVSGNWKNFSGENLDFQLGPLKNKSAISLRPLMLDLMNRDLAEMKKAGLMFGKCIVSSTDSRQHSSTTAATTTTTSATSTVTDHGSGVGPSYVPFGDPSLQVDQFVLYLKIGVSGLDDTAARVCGIDKKKGAICVRLQWNGEYMNECPSASRKTLEVRQTVDSQLDGKFQLSSWVKFGLWWTLEQRISEFLAEHWAQFTLPLKRVADSAEDLLQNLSQDLVTILDCFEWPITDHAVAQLALDLARGDVDQAMNLLFDDDQEQKLRAQALDEARVAQQQLVSAGSKTPFAQGSAGDPVHWAQQLVQFVKHRLGTVVYQRCVICDDLHPLTLLKPTCCVKDMCSFQFTTFGLGVSVEHELLIAPAEVDLLICATAAGTLDAARFQPFPDVERGRRNKQTGSVDVLKFASPQAVGQTAAKFPSVDEMKRYVEQGTLRQQLETLDPLLYLLLRWIVGTNRAHIERMSPADQFTEMHTPHQFVLRAMSPDKEKRFRELRKQHGSFFAFHGSGMSNWHNILRAGLQNMSGTKFQSSGAAYGPGIYLAADAGTSVGYARQVNVQWANSMYNNDTNTSSNRRPFTPMQLMALCEIIDHGKSGPCLQKVHRPRCPCRTGSPYFRVEENEFCATRFLFVFSGNVRPNCMAASLAAKASKLTVK